MYLLQYIQPLPFAAKEYVPYKICSEDIIRHMKSHENLMEILIVNWCPYWLNQVDALHEYIVSNQGFFRQVVQITVARLPTQILNDLRKFSKVLQIFPSILRLS